MSTASRSDVQNFSRELDRYREILHQCKGQLEKQPLLDKQISFWMESTRFLITELEVWAYLSNHEKYGLTESKVKKVMYQLHTLILQLIEES